MKLAKDIQADLGGKIQNAAEKLPFLDSCCNDIISQFILCEKWANSFYGRKDLLAKAMKYYENSVEETKDKDKKGTNEDGEEGAENEGSNIFVIHGKAGAGATCLMAKVAADARAAMEEKEVQPVSVIRFCGTSETNSSIRNLLYSMCVQIYRAYSTSDHLPYIPDDYHSLKQEFSKAIEFVAKQAEGQPLLMHIDSLDQLSDDDCGRIDLDWLPVQLPPNVFLTVSTLSDVGGVYNELIQKEIPESNYLEIPQLTKKNAALTLMGWLATVGRKLKPKQNELVGKLALDSSLEEASMLRLKLLFDIASKWASYQKPPSNLVPSIGGLLEIVFKKIETVHGIELVSTFCALLAVSKHGLPESDIIDILSTDESVVNEVLENHKPPYPCVPYHVFCRLRHDLADYIIERGQYDKTVLYWSHGLISQAATHRYIENDAEKGTQLRIRCALLISEYYGEKAHEKYPERNLTPQTLFWMGDKKAEVKFNLTKMSELPHAVNQLPDCHILSECPCELFSKCICSLSFITATCAAGLGRDLLYEAGDALSKMPDIPSITVKNEKENEEGKDEDKDIQNDQSKEQTETEEEPQNSEEEPKTKGQILSEKFRQYYRYLQSNVHVLKEAPELALQQVYSMPNALEHLHQDAGEVKIEDIVPWKEHGKNMCPFIKVNKSEALDPLVNTIPGENDLAGEITNIEAIEVGNRGFIVVGESSDERHRFYIYDLKTGRYIYRINKNLSEDEDARQGRFTLLKDVDSSAESDSSFLIIYSCVDCSIRIFKVIIGDSLTSEEGSIVNTKWPDDVDLQSKGDPKLPFVKFACTDYPMAPQRMVTACSCILDLPDSKAGKKKKADATSGKLHAGFAYLKVWDIDKCITAQNGEVFDEPLAVKEDSSQFMTGWGDDCAVTAFAFHPDNILINCLWYEEKVTPRSAIAIVQASSFDPIWASSKSDELPLFDSMKLCPNEFLTEDQKVLYGTTGSSIDLVGITVVNGKKITGFVHHFWSIESESEHEARTVEITKEQNLLCLSDDGLAVYEIADGKGDILGVDGKTFGDAKNWSKQELQINPFKHVGIFPKTDTESINFCLTERPLYVPDSPKNKLICTVSREGRIHVSDLSIWKTNEEEDRLPAGNKYSVLSNDKDHLFVTSARAINKWNAKTGEIDASIEKLDELDEYKNIEDIAISSDDKTLLCRNIDNVISQFDLSDIKERKTEIQEDRKPATLKIEKAKLPSGEEEEINAESEENYGHGISIHPSGTWAAIAMPYAGKLALCLLDIKKQADSHIVIHDNRLQEAEDEGPPVGAYQGNYKACFSNDGSLLAAWGKFSIPEDRDKDDYPKKDWPPLIKIFKFKEKNGSVKELAHIPDEHILDDSKFGKETNISVCRFLPGDEVLLTATLNGCIQLRSVPQLDMLCKCEAFRNEPITDVHVVPAEKGNGCFILCFNAAEYDAWVKVLRISKAGEEEFKMEILGQYYNSEAMVSITGFIESESNELYIQCCNASGSITVIKCGVKQEEEEETERAGAKKETPKEEKKEKSPKEKKEKKEKKKEKDKDKEKSKDKHNKDERPDSGKKKDKKKDKKDKSKDKTKK